MNNIIGVRTYKVNSNYGFIVTGNFDIKYEVNSFYGVCEINYIEDDFLSPDDRDVALNKVLVRICKGR
ncbi:MAG: hypothetical protein U9Q66_00435 [Patescibacteria group bacterium]|nr:hypothetical protein [Patescibacteria group bacterium]